MAQGYAIIERGKSTSPELGEFRVHCVGGIPGHRESRIFVCLCVKFPVAVKK